MYVAIIMTYTTIINMIVIQITWLKLREIRNTTLI